MEYHIDYNNSDLTLSNIKKYLENRGITLSEDDNKKITSIFYKVDKYLTDGTKSK